MKTSKFFKSLLILGFLMIAAPQAKAQYYNSTSTQTEKPKCAATTSSGYQCSRNAKSGSNYCTQHGNKNVHDNGYRYTSSCQAISKSTGVQCRNKAKEGSSYCGTHNK